MNNTNCFKTVKEVVDKASNRFKPIWKISNERLNILKSYCQMIDTLMDEFGCTEYAVSVDDNEHKVSIILTCDRWVSIKDRPHVFYQIAVRAVFVGFYASKNNGLDVKFVFPSLWVEAQEVI